jgi:heme O synthase-like polyprenyltransferase
LSIVLVVLVVVLLVVRTIGGTVPAYFVPSGIAGTGLITWAVAWMKKKIKGRRDGSTSDDTPPSPH